MIQLLNTTFEDHGHTIRYDYSTSDDIAHFFKRKESFYVTYDQDVSSVPIGIAVIPFLANVMPIAWFIGATVFVDEVDAAFDEALQQLKTEFARHFAEIQPGGVLQATRRTKTKFATGAKALLFSGGLDSFESLVRHLDEQPYLISVRGADIELTDTKRWDDFVRFNREEAIVDDARQKYVTSNLRTFYTPEVDLLVNVGWWGKIQHGMALISLIAPLSYLHGIGTVYIASSNTGEVSFGWGSTSETDELMRWGELQVVHDGFHLRRTEKVAHIVDFAKRTGHHIKLRVCYSEWRTGYNCSQCTKCQRTMLALALCGANPDDFGFNTPKDLYARILNNFKPDAIMTTGVLYEWRCLQDLARQAENPFVLHNAAVDREKIATFAALSIADIVNRNVEAQIKSRRWKYVVISRFPKLFHFYLKLRRITR